MISKKLKNYFEDNKKVGEFGIKYLDDELNGICKSDLILIGARSGAGKSTIANSIAKINGQKGKKVTLISLENFEGETYAKEVFYEYKKISKDYSLTFRKFKQGSFEKKVNTDLQIEQAEAKVQKTFNNITEINRTEHYTIDELKTDLIKAVGQEDTDLVILDHIDYLDKPSESLSDNEHISMIMREIRTAQSIFKVPVIIISHLRKPANTKIDVKVPSMDEFIGSSNKVKEATCVILLAPDDETNTKTQSTTKATWCCYRKYRDDGIKNQAAKIFFDIKTGVYDNKYKLYSINYIGDKVVELGFNDEQMEDL